MELDHEFTVPADAPTVWLALLDVARMAPLMPGVLLEGGSDGEHSGRVKLKFGPTTVTLRGTTQLLVTDDLTRTAIIEAYAREARGPGTATATFQATVHPAADSCRVTVHTKLALTGRVASFSEPLIHDTGAKILTRFAAALTEALAEPEPVAVPLAQPEPVTEPEPVAVEAVATEEVAVEEIAAEEVEEPKPPMWQEPAWFDYPESRGSLGRRLLAAVATLFLLALIARRVLAGRKAG